MTAQGLTFTSQTSLWSRWAPVNERTILVGISQMACYLGTLACNALSGLIADQLGWQWIFYIYGITAVLWAIIWLTYFKNLPEEMTSINAIELNYIIENRSQSVK